MTEQAPKAKGHNQARERETENGSGKKMPGRIGSAKEAAKAGRAAGNAGAVNSKGEARGRAGIIKPPQNLSTRIGKYVDMYFLTQRAQRSQRKALKKQLLSFFSVTSALSVVEHLFTIILNRIYETEHQVYKACTYKPTLGISNTFIREGEH
jgi:hypothetical protein